MTSKVDAVIAKLKEKPSAERFEEIAQLFRDCELAVNDGVGDIEPLLVRVREETGNSWDSEFFFELWGWTSPEELAGVYGYSIKRPEPEDFDHTELVALLERIEAELQEPKDKVWQYLGDCLGPAFNTDLIYHPYRDMTARELAEEIIHRRQLLDDGGIAALDAYERGIAKRLAESDEAKPWQRQWARGVVRRNR